MVLSLLRSRVLYSGANINTRDPAKHSAWRDLLFYEDLILRWSGRGIRAEGFAPWAFSNTVGVCITLHLCKWLRDGVIYIRVYRTSCRPRRAKSARCGIGNYFRSWGVEGASFIAGALRGRMSVRALREGILAAASGVGLSSTMR